MPSIALCLTLLQQNLSLHLWAFIYETSINPLRYSTFIVSRCGALWHDIQLCQHTVGLYFSNFLYEEWKREILWIYTFDNDRTVKGCRWYSASNWIHDSKKFLGNSTQNVWGKTCEKKFCNLKKFAIQRLVYQYSKFQLIQYWNKNLISFTKA